MHLADAFIQSDLQWMQVIHFLSVCVFLGIEPTTICAANAMLYHWATGTTCLWRVPAQDQDCRKSCTLFVFFILWQRILFSKKKKKTASDLASTSMSFNASASTLSTNYLIFITHLSDFFYLYCEMQVFCVSHRVDLRRLNICLTHCLCWSLGLKNKQTLI